MNDETQSSATAAALPSEVAEPAGAADVVRRPPRWLRGIVSCWILFHLAAIVSAPASVAPSSRLAQRSWAFFRPYLQLLYLNHGYHYFAPEPSFSTLVAYRVERPDGSRLDGRIPHRDIRPRLLYHRHFMLTENFNFAPQDSERPWYRTYARHLCRRHGGERASLTRQTHYLPTMEAVREGVSLDDPASYAEEPLGIFSCDE
jgi:hypothetical protein